MIIDLTLSQIWSFTGFPSYSISIGRKSTPMVVMKEGLKLVLVFEVWERRILLDNDHMVLPNCNSTSSTLPECLGRCFSEPTCFLESYLWTQSPHIAQLPSSSLPPTLHPESPCNRPPASHKSTLFGDSSARTISLLITSLNS